MALSDVHIDRLIGAIVDSFSSDEFKTVVDSIRVDVYSEDDRFEQNVGAVLKLSSEEGWDIRLLDELLQERPSNEEIRAVAKAVMGPDQLQSSLERMVTSERIHNLAWYLHRPQMLKRRICRVEITMPNLRTSVGTGFLVGPDLVLTNYHVMEPLIDGRVRASRVACRFDFEQSADGLNTEEGRTIKIKATKAIVASSPVSPKDEASIETPLSEAWGEDALDYALIQLRETIGSEAINSRIPNTAERGWINLPETPRRLKADQQIKILQHPEGQAIRISEGRAQSDEAYNLNQTRFRHDANTLRGSSGSPCFNGNWELIGLHHAGSPDSVSEKYNQGIDIHYIRTDLKSKGVELKRFEEAMDMHLEVLEAIGNNLGDAGHTDDFNKWLLTEFQIVEGELPDDPGQRTNALLNMVRLRGKFPKLIRNVAEEFPNNLDLKELLDSYISRYPDPFESALMDGYKPLLNRYQLRELLRSFGEDINSNIVLIDGKPESGKSYTTKYLTFLRNQANVFDHCWKIDVNEILKYNTDGTEVTAVDIAKNISEQMGLGYADWDLPFKFSPFYNALMLMLSERKEKVILCFDGFNKVEGYLAKNASDFVNHLAIRLDDQPSEYLTLILIDFKQYLHPELVGIVDEHEPSRPGLEDLAIHFTKVYEERKRRDPSKDFSEDDIIVHVEKIISEHSLSDGDLRNLNRDILRKTRTILRG